jgi:hypothetical protein
VPTLELALSATVVAELVLLLVGFEALLSAFEALDVALLATFAEELKSRPLSLDWMRRITSIALLKKDE